MEQKSHPDRGVVNSGRFEEIEWGELIHYFPFRCKGKKISLIHNCFQLRKVDALGEEGCPVRPGMTHGAEMDINFV